MSVRAGKAKAMGDVRRGRAATPRAMPRERPSAGEGTRERLVQVARQLFAERGFHHVTVRDIIQEAGANLAAVGYHFGDKLGLYRHVVEAEIAAMVKLNESLRARANDPRENVSAEEKIRIYIRNYLPRLMNPEPHVEWAQRVFRHEMAQPTPIAQEIADKILKPRMRYLAELVAEAMGSDVSDKRVQLCAFSIQAQCMFYVRDAFRSFVLPRWPAQTHEELRIAADHIADFSIAGMRELASK
jgi:AcrR family transcriptional regulator